jgi:heat shock protein HslJ
MQHLSGGAICSLSVVRTGTIASTRRACPDLGQETAYFAALADMRFAEVAGTVLILSNKAGGEMVFQAE